jgi:hypothetical protein
VNRDQLFNDHNKRLRKRRRALVRVDLTQVFHDLDGNCYQSDKGDLTLAVVCVGALFAGEKIPGDEAYKRHCLVDRIHGKTEVELDPADLAKVRTIIGESQFNVRIRALAWDMLDAAKSQGVKPKES